MEMDWGTALVGIVTLSACIVPLVIIYFNRVKNENNMLRSLRENAQRQTCNISKHEFCGDFILGIDEEKNTLFFFKQKKEEAISQCVDLSEIHTCQVVKNTRNIKTDVGTTTLFEQIALSFIPIVKSKPATTFELYTEDTSIQLSGELQFAEHWSKQITDRLKGIK